MTDAASPASPVRPAVVAAALTLFDTQGFEATSVDQIAKAAGVSRSTFFRQFGGKEDVVFADHEEILAELRVYLEGPHDDPWLAVCTASEWVFDHFAADPEVARLRYRVVRGVPALREREIVTVFRYERLFDDYLRRRMPGVDPIDAVSFAAVVTAIHNHLLRRLLRGDDAARTAMSAALARARERFGVGDPASAEDDIIVAVFPRTMPTAELSRRLRARLDETH